MRLVVISDTHNRHKKIELPDGDMLIHCGDFTGQGRKSEIEEFAKWLRKLDQFKYKLVIAGNHDLMFEADPLLAKSILIPNGNWIDGVVYLEEESVTIRALNFYGSPFSKKFNDWAFMGTEEQLAKRYANIPSNTDVLITHGPPKFVLDNNWDGEHCGSQALLDKVREIRPQLSVFGHIHESYGTEDSLYWKETAHKYTKFGNAAICDLSYRPVNKPLVFDVEPPRSLGEVAAP